MARKVKPPDPPPSKAYLISFGDTMTALLAFFIVLCSLAKDQTGANLYRGTGSFVNSARSMGLGLPGAFSSKTSKKVVEQKAASPLYLGEEPDDDKEPAQNATGPDEEDDRQRIINRELDVYQRYLNDLERMWDIDSMPEVKGEATFDLFNRLEPEPPYLNAVYKDALKQVLPLLRRESYHVEIVVWAQMPSPKSWQTASTKAQGLRNELCEFARLPSQQKQRLSAVGMTWKYPDVRRPVASIIVKKINPK